MTCNSLLLRDFQLWKTAHNYNLFIVHVIFFRFAFGECVSVEIEVSSDSEPPAHLVPGAASRRAEDTSRCWPLVLLATNTSSY